MDPMKPAPGSALDVVHEQPWTVRPQGMDGILTDAIRVMRADFWRLTGILGLVLVPANVLVAVMIYLFMRHMGRVPTMDGNAAATGVLVWGLALAGAVMVWGMVVPFAQVALMRGIRDRYMGRRVSIRRAYGWMLSHVWMVAGTVVLMSLVVLAGFLMLVLPGVVALFLLMLTVPVMVTEGRGGFDALQRSALLVSRGAPRLLLLVAVTWIVGMTVSTVLQVLIPQPQIQGELASTADLLEYYNTSALATALTTALSGLTQSVISTLRGAVYLLSYVDIRCRTEGYDIEVAAEMAGIWRLADPAPPTGDAPGAGASPEGDVARAAAVPDGDAAAVAPDGRGSVSPAGDGGARG